jgi:hypothetical protein
MHGLAAKFAALVDAYDPVAVAKAPRAPAPPGTLEHIGRAMAQQLGYARRLADFAGECGAALRLALRGRVCWGEVLIRRSLWCTMAPKVCQGVCQGLAILKRSKRGHLQ